MSPDPETGENEVQATTVRGNEPPRPKAGSESYLDSDGNVRYRWDRKNNQRKASTLPDILTEEQLTGEESISEQEWRQVLERMGMAESNRTKGKNARQKRRNSNKTPKGIDVTMRRAKALELRRAGYSYEEIARVPSLGYKQAGHVQQDLSKLYSQMLDEPAKDVLALELSRLEAVVRYVWQQVREGELPAIDRLLTAMRIKHQLLGLNKPIQHEVVTTDHLDNEVERLTRELDRMEQAPVVDGELVEIGEDGKSDDELVSFGRPVDQGPNGYDTYHPDNVRSIQSRDSTDR